MVPFSNIIHWPELLFKWIIALVFIRLAYLIVLLFSRKFILFYNYIMLNSEYYHQRKWVFSHRDGKDVVYKYIDVYNPQRGWTLIPNLNKKAFRGSYVSSNADGERSERELPRAKDCVLFLGDSFCFGECVNDDQTIPYLFEKKTGSIPSVNLGVHGYGIDQQYLYLKEVISKYNPKLVCFIICYEDFGRNFLDFRDYAKPKYVLRNNNIELTNYPVPEPAHYMKKPSSDFFLPASLDFIRQVFVYYGLLERKKREKICVHIMRQIVDTAKSADAPLMFLYVPNYLSRFLRNYTDSFFLRHFKKNNIPCLSLGDIFTNNELRDMSDGKTGHFTPHSNDLIAEKLADYVKEQGLI